ncbi:MAG: hypothetical protein M1826_001140 [Phylliscum demangeonii]|nr:MAG: hypothetical protein M1826_001140 [Phylliscum demangeonii]
MPDIGPEDLPSSAIEEMDHHELLTKQEITDFQREWQYMRGELLEKLWVSSPYKEPPNAEILYPKQAFYLLQKMYMKIDESIGMKKEALQRSQLHSAITEEEFQYRKSSEAACALREEARECERKAGEAEQKIAEYKKKLNDLDSRQTRQGQRSNANAKATPKPDPEPGKEDEISATGVGHQSKHGLSKTGFAVDEVVTSVKHKRRPLLHRLQSMMEFVGAKAETMTRDGTARVLEMERAGAP